MGGPDYAVGQIDDRKIERAYPQRGSCRKFEQTRTVRGARARCLPSLSKSLLSTHRFGEPWRNQSGSSDASFRHCPMAISGDGLGDRCCDAWSGDRRCETADGLNESMPVGPGFLGPIISSDFAPGPTADRSALRAWRFDFAPILSQACHSFEMILITEGKCGRPGRLRSCVAISDSRSASRIAPRASAVHTPARAAISPRVSVHVPQRSTSSAMTLVTASWPVVKYAASRGGMGPDAASRRRRAIERWRSGDFGRRLRGNRQTPCSTVALILALAAETASESRRGQRSRGLLCAERSFAR